MEQNEYVKHGDPIWRHYYLMSPVISAFFGDEFPMVLFFMLNSSILGGD